MKDVKVLKRSFHMCIVAAVYLASPRLQDHAEGLPY